MNKLLEKLKKPKKQKTEMEIVDIEEESSQTPIEAWNGPEIKKETTFIKVKDTFKNRHQAQQIIIKEQNRKLKNQQNTIQELLKNKLDHARQVYTVVSQFMRLFLYCIGTRTSK